MSQNLVITTTARMSLIPFIGAAGLIGMLYVVSPISIWHLLAVSLLIVGITWLFARNFE